MLEMKRTYDVSSIIKTLHFYKSRNASVCVSKRANKQKTHGNLWHARVLHLRCGVSGSVCRYPTVPGHVQAKYTCCVFRIMDVGKCVIQLPRHLNYTTLAFELIYGYVHQEILCQILSQFFVNPQL